MAKTLKVMCVHGLGDHRQSDWKTKWPAAVRQVFPVPDVTLEFEFVTYDQIFERVNISAWESAKAVAKLAASGVTSIFRRERGVVGDISEKIRWTAGYVVAWVEDDGFKAQSRKLVLDAVKEKRPDVILAHSLGTLVTYNAFTHPDVQKDPELLSALGRATYVTFGSQINNPFVIRNLTNGRIQRLDVNFWHHLYNEHDDVFTAAINNWMPDPPNFRQSLTPFDLDGVGDHAAEGYLAHRATVENVWRPLGSAKVGAKTLGFAAAPVRQRVIRRKPRRKALLVGINDYPNPADRLEGCINDVFTMSAVLQEAGFAPESIRTCLDARATAEGIVSRLRWLLDEAQAGDELVFYYSGHGARIPEYGEEFEPDRHVEVLVPYDFDWTPETAVSDDQIHGLYSQLPYDTRFVMIMDCCHSGGIHRDGGAKARGITPPDDVRHRELKWDAKSEMWVPRNFKPLNAEFTSDEKAKERYFGKKGATERLGRSGMLRGLSARAYGQLKREQPELAGGPYLPLIIEACREEQLSYEYRHGASSHGAFTYSLARILRRERRNGAISFEKLVELTRNELRYLQYDQEPQILGPTHIMKAPVPWVKV